MGMKIRVVVVEDSLTVRRHLIDVLGGDADIDVVGEADDGKRAIDLCRELRPDIVTLDMMLPVMTGLAATEYIMAHCPTPILIISSSTNRGELVRTYEALAAGAVDVLEKPRGDEVGDEWERKLLSTVKLVSRIKVITHLRGKLRAQAPLSLPPRASRPSCDVVAIGASTGGPGALAQILRTLPASYPIPILLVLHIGEVFARQLADWLDALSHLSVAFAKDGDPIPPVGRGSVLMAPPSHHLVVRGGRLRLTKDAERHSCRPSVDALFESLADDMGSRSAACLLTGMGRDGASGLLRLRQAGARTIAQDEATSVVFGMPHEAILLGAAERVLALGDIARALVDLTGREKELP